MAAGFVFAVEPVPTLSVEGQPLAANVQRVAEALDYLGAPLPSALRAELTNAA